MLLFSRDNVTDLGDSGKGMKIQIEPQRRRGHRDRTEQFSYLKIKYYTNYIGGDGGEQKNGGGGGRIGNTFLQQRREGCAAAMVAAKRAVYGQLSVMVVGRKWSKHRCFHTVIIEHKFVRVNMNCGRKWLEFRILGGDRARPVPTAGSE